MIEPHKPAPLKVMNDVRHSVQDASGPLNLSDAPDACEGNPVVVSVTCFAPEQLPEIIRTKGRRTGKALMTLAVGRVDALLNSTGCTYNADGNRIIVMSRETDPRLVYRIASVICAALAGEYVYADEVYNLRFCAGAAIARASGTPWGTVLAQAEQAMNEIPHGSTEPIRLYTEDSGVQEEQPLGKGDLQRALEHHELVLHYQPRIDLESGELKGMEALLRWDHPRLGRIMPGHFISLAEESGMIGHLGRWVLGEACRQARDWSVRMLKPFRMSVNVSAHQLQPELVEEVSAALQEHGLDGRFLELEITESVMVRNMTEAVPLLEAVKDYGVSISIDDFGRGYTSVRYLEAFPADCLKIDRSFLNRSLEQQQKIIPAIISLGRRFGLEIVGEGIETPDQLKLLRELECDTGQGFLFSRPIDSEAFELEYMPFTQA
ncbi:putative bifunctional diguanylate cyclase/phosphodiesterase ['Paenibacillus yunnanensis' Narsing Rao et al. 2020]|uniref:putative bifunctional diguanylate cyclase/phosphodiesterase n=1 Tax=Paenibacillus tengchongensis TaxID=2608684 RepID=UPI00124D9DA3|nr:EAL domain-containing protein [Paenibacillus tengchongensis]